MKKILVAILVVVIALATIRSFVGTGLNSKLNAIITGNSEPDDVVVTDPVVGTGDVAESGKFIKIHYTTYLERGMKKIDSSRDRGIELKFKLGAGLIIPGWERGIMGMKVGGQRKIMVPSKLAYGPKGAGRAVPPSSTLIYETELLSISDTDPAVEEASKTKPPETAKKTVKKSEHKAK